MKRIAFACVRCKQKGFVTYTLATGFSHDMCYNYLSQAHGMYPIANPEKYDVEEGFVLENGDFVDRMTAMWIAEDAEQLKEEYRGKDYPLLYSYMLNYKKIKEKTK